MQEGVWRMKFLKERTGFRLVPDPESEEEAEFLHYIWDQEGLTPAERSPRPSGDGSVYFEPGQFERPVKYCYKRGEM